MTSRFVCTILVVPTEKKAIILVKLIVSTLCGLAAPTQPRFEFLCVGHNPSPGCGECVFFQEYKESFSIAACGVLVAQHSGSALQAEGME